MNLEPDNAEMAELAEADRLASMHHYGIVIMLDALGVRNETLTNPVKFSHKINRFLDDLEPNLNAFREALPKANIETTILGDTVIVTSDFCDDVTNEVLTTHLLEHAALASGLVVFGMKHGLYFRGAISVGEYFKESITLGDSEKPIGNSLVGPAISDAANWHESADWIGVILTPKTGLVLDGNRTHFLSFGRDYVAYSVPLVSSRSKVTHQELYTVPWPVVLSVINEGEFETTEDLLKIIKEQLSRQTYIPVGTEQKYYNTIDFAKRILADKGMKQFIDNFAKKK